MEDDEIDDFIQRLLVCIQEIKGGVAKSISSDTMP